MSLKSLLFVVTVATSLMGQLPAARAGITIHTPSSNHVVCVLLSIDGLEPQEMRDWVWRGCARYAELGGTIRE